MYLSNIKLWNFRKFGTFGAIDLQAPHLDLSFTPGVNVLIGENDSGKTAILEAIKMVLKTHAYERMLWEDDDFYEGTDEIRIELLVDGMTDREAAHFTEWLGWTDGNPKRPVLRLIYKVRRTDGRIIPTEVRAGMDDVGSPMDVLAREYLKVTFLKPLRDAENELTAKKYSRLSQILEGHELFKEGADGKAAFEGYVATANDNIRDWFEDNTAEAGQDSNKAQIKDVIDGFLGRFVKAGTSSTFSIAGARIKEILEKLSLHLSGIVRPGLGTMNRLYMATELLHLQKAGWTGMKLCLVEEEEAHLHPQAQMKVLETIQNQKGTQFIITTHSPNLASKVRLYDDEENQVIICKDGKVYPMGAGHTLLEKSDYRFLDHFLDVTKANLFFANGIVLVEGWAEQILLPVIAKKMNKDFTSHEVSIVNVGSTAYMRYAKIFMRRNQQSMGCKVAIVTDLDIRPRENDGQFDTEEENRQLAAITSKVDTANYPDISWHIAPHWTLEWCLFQSERLGSLMMEAVHKAHPRIEGFKKDAEGHFNNDLFRQELTNRLKKYKIGEEGRHVSVDGIDKVEVAYHLSHLIEEAQDLNFDNMENDTAYYLVSAINHVCID